MNIVSARKESCYVEGLRNLEYVRAEEKYINYFTKYTAQS